MMNTRFDVQTIALILAWVGTGCWVVSFWWMHRLSARQQATLKELHEVTKRIEKLSKAEHDLLQEVHPAVRKNKGISKRRGRRRLSGRFIRQRGPTMRGRSSSCSGGTCFRTSRALVVNAPNEWDVRKHVPPRLS